ncbi:glycosyltransferase [Tieghemostelium lacteum]|uniref:Fucosyltransferase n=1 Tax=Tieghemostelium lacteum TaxID=361077 RepID=A0A151Z6N2_TIELA|nr:glycosyltransferase [Tieghemostelium lacteum]|eukprot:KYQ89444.1 glycosyltransferase [Tieghemostelium lacteum]
MLKNPTNRSVEVLHWETNHHWAGWGQKSGEMVGWAGYKVEKDRCKYQCHFHGNQSKYSTADAIIFEPQPFGDRGDPYPLTKPCGQKYVMFSYETPIYFPRQSNAEYLSHMDWRMTFEESSEVRVSMMCSWGFEGGIEAYRREISPPFKQKQGFAVFVASNCHSGGALQRTQYVEDLMRYIPVDSFGLCLQNQPSEALDRNTARERFAHKIEVFSRYKFVLAFENNNYTDYVTEKLSHALLSTSIPVYMGPESVEDYVPGDKSIIKTSDFKSPQDLANYLLNLAENEEDYLSYFKWKKQYFRTTFVRRYKECIFNVECRLCERIVEERVMAQSHPDEYTNQPHYSLALTSGISNQLLGNNYILDHRFFTMHEITLVSIVLLLILYTMFNNVWLLLWIFQRISKLFKIHSKSTTPHQHQPIPTET